MTQSVLDRISLLNPALNAFITVEPERAIARIERLLVTPYGSYSLTQATLRIDPIWDPLRSHPRFKAIVEVPEPKTIYN